MECGFGSVMFGALSCLQLLSIECGAVLHSFADGKAPSSEHSSTPNPQSETRTLCHAFGKQKILQNTLMFPSFGLETERKSVSETTKTQSRK